MRWILRFVAVSLVWAAMFGAVSIAFGRSTEAVVLGVTGAFLFGLAGLHCGRWWQP